MKTKIHRCNYRHAGLAAALLLWLAWAGGCASEARASAVSYQPSAVSNQGYCPERLLAAIAERECPGGWDGVPGAAGELSVYQLTPAVWRQHMGGRPLREAWNILEARECARRHLAWLDAGLRRHGYAPTPERLALAWNVGLAGALRRGCRPHAYALQVANIYAAQAATNAPLTTWQRGTAALPRPRSARVMSPRRTLPAGRPWECVGRASTNVRIGSIFGA